MKMVSYLKKIKLAIKAANDVMKYGGINTADICQIKWENVLREKRILITGAGSGIGFAIATVVEPDILIADEVLAVGDFLFQEKCEKRIQHMKDNGTTILLVSHSIAQIEANCDRVMWIEKGKVKMIGNTKEVCDLYKQTTN